MELLCDHRCIKLTVCLFQAVMVLCWKHYKVSACPIAAYGPSSPAP